jgi:hypothetical protein
MWTAHNSLRPGGYFIADFFGPAHAFAVNRKDINFLTEQQVRDLLPPTMEVLRIADNGAEVKLVARKRTSESMVQDPAGADVQVAFERTPEPPPSEPGALTPIARAARSFSVSPLGKALQLSPLLLLTASARLPTTGGVSFDAAVEQKVRALSTEMLRQLEQQDGSAKPGEAPNQAAAQPTEPGQPQSWSNVNQLQPEQPVTLLRPIDPNDPTLIDGLAFNPRHADRVYHDVLLTRSLPFNGSSSFLFVPNFVAEQGVGWKGSGAHPKDWGNGFFRGANFNVQPLEMFASRTFALDNSQQVLQSSTLRMQVSNRGGDYFAGGTHRAPSGTGGLNIDNLFNSKHTATSRFGEVFANFPYAWTRPETISYGGRVMGRRHELVFNPLDGSRLDNGSPGQSSYQLGAPYTWAQDNVKLSLALDPWAGYAYMGFQEEMGLKLFGTARDHALPGSLPVSNWHIVNGKVVPDLASNRAAWERSLEASGLTL